MSETATRTDVVDDFLHAVQHATIATCQSWSADCVLDATVPNWRFRRRGPEEIRREYSRWFADPGHFDEFERHTIGDLHVVRYLLSWTENGVPHAAHHLHMIKVRDGFIAADTVLCGGRWSASLLAEMEAADG